MRADIRPNGKPSFILWGNPFETHSSTLMIPQGRFLYWDMAIAKMNG
jgi:hypothetical protein